MDVSANTRETTLDLLWQCLTKLSFQDKDKLSHFERQFVIKYLPIIMERADDQSIGCRKKVVQILTYVLQNQADGISQTDIIKILLRKWAD
jgi:hypothetical protein